MSAGRVTDAAEPASGVAGEAASAVAGEPASGVAGEAASAVAGEPASAVAPTKAARHATIAQILAHHPVRSQSELREALAVRGVQATQATLSRDLDELRAQKVRGPGGEQVYALPMEGGSRLPVVAEESEQIAARLQRWCADLLVSADTTANQVVLRTPPGAAQLLAYAIDHSVLPGVLGCIAGDDTVLVIVRDEAGAQALAARLLDLATRGRTRPGTGPGDPDQT